MLYPNGSDLPLGRLIFHGPHPIIGCPASFPLTWCPCALGGQTNPIEAPSILCCCLGHLLNGLQSNTICSKSETPISHAQVLHLRSRLWSQMKLHTYSHKPNASCLMHPTLHLISSHLISSTLEVPGSSIFLCSLAICPSLSFIGYLKRSNQDTLPHPTIETIQYRYPPSPHRA